MLLFSLPEESPLHWQEQTENEWFWLVVPWISFALFLSDVR